MNKYKILAGITHDNELYFLEIEGKSETKSYFSISGFTVRPVLKDEAISHAFDYLDDEGDYFWRQAVEAKATTEGLDDWIQQVKDEGDEMGNFDNSLFDSELEIDGETYVFESGSCGQHEEKDLKHYFISKQLYNQIMKAWKQCHLEEKTLNEIISIGYPNSLGYEMEKLPPQNIDATAMQAVTLINSYNN